MAKRELQDEEACPNCGGPRALRHRKQKLLSYILFVASFIVFFVFDSVRPLSAVAKGLWFAVQVALAVWAYIDRRNNAKRLFYCRSCNTRLPF